MTHKIYSDLCLWRNAEAAKPLMLIGAPRVGKTYLLKQFGASEFEHTFYASMTDEESVAALLDKQYQGAETFVIIDDVTKQAAAKEVVESLLHKAPTLRIALAGKMPDSIADYQILHLYPLDFEEFLSAICQDGIRAVISSGDESLITRHHEVCTRLMLHYCFTGGMPEAVNEYVTSGDLFRVRAVQTDILNRIFGRIAADYPLLKADKMLRVLYALPEQMMSLNRIYDHKKVYEEADAAEYADAVNELVRLGLLAKIRPCVIEERTGKSVRTQIDTTSPDFKLYMCDTGLYGALVETPIYDTGISVSFHDSYNGAFSELYALTQLLPNTFGRISYYQSEETSIAQPAHIDFIVDDDTFVYPMVVEPITMSKNPSLKAFCEQYRISTGLRLSMLRFRHHEYFPNLPLYILPCLRGWLVSHGY